MMTSTTRPTLAVHVVFHPASNEGRLLARAIDGALNGRDPVTGQRSDVTAHLAIPTFFLPEETAPDRVGLPPQPAPGESPDEWLRRLWPGERNLVVVLSDEHLAAPPVAGEGDPAHDWSVWVRRYCPAPERLAAADHNRILLVQVSEEGWPLHADFQSLSFCRTTPPRELEIRQRQLVRRVIQELCRLVASEHAGAEAEPAPIRVFISHAKADLAQEPRVVEALLNALKGDQPVRSWVDSGRIQPGTSFVEAIHGAIRDHSMLCVVTDHYSGRPWCRIETIEAKRQERPMVAIDALATRDLLASPYLGNIPVLRWSATDAASSQAQANLAIDLLVAETLRRGHARLELRRSVHREPGSSPARRSP